YATNTVSTDISAVIVVIPAVIQPAVVSAAASDVPAAAGAVPAAVQPRWQPPKDGRMKCNVDAAFSSQGNKTGVGIFILDEDGVFVLARTVTLLMYIRLT
ncbi:hypothetical protein MTR_1964s0010, partial [Medicago truncatula]